MINNRVPVPLLGQSQLGIHVEQVNALPGVDHLELKAAPVTFQVAKQGPSGQSLTVFVVGGLSRLEDVTARIVSANPSMAVEEAVELAKRILGACHANQRTDAAAPQPEA